MITPMALLAIAMLGGVVWWRVRRVRRGYRLGRRKTVLALVAAILGLQIVIGIPAFADQCGQAPIPEAPGLGMVGAIDPPAMDHGAPDTNYGNYSYAGTTWHVYETNCTLSTTITDPNAVIDTWIGNQLFNVGKVIVASTNSLHYAMLSQDSMFAPLDNAIQAAAKTFYNNIYARYVSVVLLILAVLLFRNIFNGNLAAISKRTLWAFAGMWLAASVVVLPALYTSVDKPLLDLTSNLQAGFVDQSQVDAQRNALPNALYDNVIFTNWERGEFGDPNSPQANQYAQELLNDQAWPKGQLSSADDQAQVTAKENDFASLPNKLGDSVANYFEGTEGSRTGDGALAFFEAIVYSLFQLCAKASVVLAQVLLRLFFLATPLIGLAAILVENLLPRIARAAGAVGFTVVLLSALAGAHALLLNLIFDPKNQLALIAQLLLAALVTIVCFVLAKPFTRMRQMIEMSVGAATGSTPNLLGWFSRNRQTQPASQNYWDGIRDGGAIPVGATGTRVRPEASPENGGTVRATARRMDQGLSTRQAISNGATASSAYVVTRAPAPRRGGGSGGYVVPDVVESPANADLVIPSKMAPRELRAINGGQDGLSRNAAREFVAGRPVNVTFRPERGGNVIDVAA